MQSGDAARQRALSLPRTAPTALSARDKGEEVMKGRLVILWLAVGVPLAWGVMKTLENAVKLFH
jgi:hypothetical protein